MSSRLLKFGASVNLKSRLHGKLFTFSNLFSIFMILIAFLAGKQTTKKVLKQINDKYLDLKVEKND